MVIETLPEFTEPVPARQFGDEENFTLAANTFVSEMFALVTNLNTNTIPGMNEIGSQLNVIYPHIDDLIAAAQSIEDVSIIAPYIEQINAVAADIANIDMVSGAITYVNAVGSNIPAIVTVSDNMAAIQAANANITDIIAAPAAAVTAATKAAEAEQSAMNAAASETAAAGYATSAEASAAMAEALTGTTPDAVPFAPVARDADANAKFGTPTDPAHAANKGYVDTLFVSVQGGLRTPVQIDLQSELPDVATAETGDYYVVSNMDVTQPGFQGRAWCNKDVSPDEWLYVVDLVQMPDGDTIVLNGESQLAISPETQATINKVDTPESVSAAIAAALSAGFGTSGKVLFSQLTAGSGTWIATDENGDGSDYTVEITIKGGGGGGSAGSGGFLFGGGGEGELVIFRRAVTPGTGVAYSVGAGGTVSNNGNSTTCSGYTASPGNGGKTNSGSGGEGGGTTSIIGDVIRIAGATGLVTTRTSYVDGSSTHGSSSGGKGGGNHGGRGAARNTRDSYLMQSTSGILGCGGGSGTAAASTDSPGSAGGAGYIIIKKV